MIAPVRNRRSSRGTSHPRDHVEAPISPTRKDAREPKHDPKPGLTLEQAIGLLLAFLGFMIGSRVISDNSFFTHFATGKQILETGTVPLVDPYSFTAAGEPWTVQSWFPSVVYRVLFEGAGLPAVRLLNGMLAAYVSFATWQLTGRARLLIYRVLLSGGAVTVGAMMWSPRPLLFGLACLAAVLQIIEGQRRLWLLVPVMWLWVNSHGSFPFAVALVGAISVGQLLDSRQVPRQELKVFGWLLAGLAAGAVNPLGPRLLVFPFELLDRREALADVAEWESPTFHRPSEWAFAVLILALIVGFKFRLRWRMVIPSLGFVGLGLMAVRNIGPAAIVIAWAAAPALGTLRGSLTGRDAGLAAKAVAITAGCCTVLVAASILGRPALDLDEYPVEAVAWLEQAGLVAEPDVNLIHRDKVGNYLELRFGDRARVFMDDRFDFFPQEVIDDHATFYFGGDFEQLLARYDADAVLWSSEGDFADWLRADTSGWTVTFEDENYVVAVPTTGGSEG